MEVETLEVETLSRDLKEREKEKSLLAQNDFSKLSKVKGNGDTGEKLKSLAGVSDQTLLELCKIKGVEWVQNYLTQQRYGKEDLNLALERLEQRIKSEQSEPIKTNAE